MTFPPFLSPLAGRRAFVMLFSVFCAVCAFGAPIKFTVTEFPNPPGHTLLTPKDINNKGEIVFASDRASEGLPDLFIYLPVPAYGMPAGLNLVEKPNRFVEPTSINDQGQVAGSMITDEVPSRRMGFVWANGVFQEFNFASPDDRTWVRSINNAGFMAGHYEVPRPGQPALRVIRGFVRTTNDATIINPVSPTTNHLSVVAINNRNHVAGSYETQWAVVWPRGFLWDGSIHPLGPYPTDQQIHLEALDLNDSDEIVGFSDDGCYLWLPAPKYGFPAGLNSILPPVTNGLGICINSSGLVATPTHLWDRGTITLMSEMLPASVEAEIGKVAAMNNHGQIIGFLKDPIEDVINGVPVLLSPAPSNPLIVNVASDDDDADPNDGIVDVDLNTPGEQVSLRAAINFANSTNSPGADTIEFDIQAGGPTILPTNALPDVIEALTIDGSSQPGGRVTLRGTLAGIVDGLRLLTTNCVIKGLIIREFPKAGLAIEGGSGHQIIGNIIGTDAGGGTGLGNGTGLRMENSSSNFIGGLLATTRNIFSGNLAAGLMLTNCADIILRANLVGTDPTGNSSLPNGQFGLIAEKINRLSIGVSSVLSVFNSPSAAVLRDIGGGTGSDAGSMINCSIGLSASGSGTGLGGTTNGLVLERSSGFTIGGIARNVFAGLSNAVSVFNSTNISIAANYIGTDRTGNTSLPVGIGILADKVRQLAIGVSNRLTVINGQNGVILRESGGVGSGSGGNVGLNASMINCNVGLNASGNASLGGTINGLRVEGGTGVGIGGAARNVFAGIVSNAVTVVNATNIQILANHFGTARSGNASLPVGVGIAADKVRDLLIGMTNQLTVINGRQAAILTEITGSDNGEGSSSEIINCHVGLNATGNAILAAVTNGLRIERSSGFKIGGGARNVFAGIVSNALTILDSTNIHVAANYIGTSSSGTTSLPVGTGIAAQNIKNLLIGTSNLLTLMNAQTAAVIRNIGGSGGIGGQTGSRMINCYVGVNANGTNALGGTTNGIVVEDSDGFVVGGTSPSERNIFGGIVSNAMRFARSANIHVRANYVGTDVTGNRRLPVSMGILADQVQNLLIGVTNIPTVFNATNMATITKLSGTANQILNCLVGLGAAGTNILGATVNGLRVDESAALAIGGDKPSERNVFGGIISHAVSVLNSSNILVGGNSFGADAFGQLSLTNRGVNLLLDNVLNVTIGNTNQVSVFGSSGSNCLQILRSSAVTIQNALIGMKPGGGGLLRNARSGILAQQCTNLLIGGLNSLERVLVGGNGRHGIEAADALGLTIRNTTVGSGPTGTELMGNALAGIKFHSTLAAAPGNSLSLFSNLVAFNQGAGIEITQDPSVLSQAIQKVIQSTQVRSNAGDGISLGTNVASVTIGGTILSEANEITRNGGSGVRMVSPGDFNFVELNSNYSNVLKAITRIFDAKHQTTMQTISAMRGSTHVQGNVSGRSNETVRLHFYAHRPKAGAQGEGEMWMGSINVPLNASGVGSYDSRLPRTAPAGWLVASTGADPVLGTSEFSASQMVQNPTDTDGDGLPDFWEALYPSCLNPLVPDPPNEDCDGDGFTNLQEYIAHTDPTQANSALRVESLVAGANGATLNFTGVAGRQYGLERRAALVTGSWVRVATAIPEADGIVILTDPNPPSGNAYYRLVAEFP